MSAAIEEEVVEGIARKPTIETQLYFETGKHIYMSAIHVATDTARQLVSINVFLLGGSFVFLDARLVHPTMRWAAMFIFFMSLVASFVATVPAFRSICVFEPYAVRDWVESRIQWKTNCLFVAWFTLALGLIVTLVAGLLRQAS